MLASSMDWSSYVRIFSTPERLESQTIGLVPGLYLPEITSFTTTRLGSEVSVLVVINTTFAQVGSVLTFVKAFS